MDVNIADAKKDLSKLVHMIEDGQEDTIWICRYNKRVAKIIGCEKVPVTNRIGIAKGKFKETDNFDKDNPLIEKLFGGEL